MRIQRTLLTLGVALAAGAACGRSDAAVIFNNLGPGDSFSASGRIVQGPSVGTIGDVNQGSTFTVGPADAYLTSVSLGVSVNSSPSVGTGPIDVKIAADAGGSPGAILRTLSTSLGSTGDQLVTLPDDGSLLLSAGATYWVLMDGEGDFDGSWRFNDTGDIGVTAGQSEPNPWNVRPPEERYALRVDGRVAVPEPTAVVLALLGAVAAGTTRRR
ncbi:hypothetical protein Pla108_33620 [Botrimarina colliarenosi]|uniref:PEP-CTERM protein-sorting domain-containing protein n=1 Tax=Botrimarina colliarenosi TaxID=2528001 RepID=A0A5C6A6S8_9BACT|nr:choice-of-anchor R domain-containing protein [Botrimarina colliarenosi]TWT95219.1 hypothetical protein Pla108_33620 [Botrimarina colliarenosi]